MLDSLFELVQKENILFSFCQMPHKLLGYYSRSYLPPVILLSNKLTNHFILQKVILAEELGHHFTASCMGHFSNGNVSAKLQIKNRIERKALWWAVQKLVPFELFVKAVNSGLIFTHELAEHFDVTERFMGTCIRLYNEKRNTETNALIKHTLQELL